ncbi:DUF427 domain-containing protein [Granulicella tundricola]|uniref:DUF427 domain-containing protein n=1 Tax=Granulicella tundricola (strain ATCC BAA-1859 / DSM 23138 / MP5ACTX9) TaxID=1198114 RepID=E8X0C1_GRATM|nr:DUF427 domain-containing protein [Granulicella tundricola]ADW70102.1 protein of unknown function DUF427 [Granulicella tundricola MP5ACTX9]
MNKGAGDSASGESESVWDYPRPPRLEASVRRIRIVHAGRVIADATQAVRILETSHPPVYYLAPADVAVSLLRRSSAAGSFCEFKGVAGYWDLIMPGADLVGQVAWSYEQPSPGYSALKGFLAFYASKVDECWVDEERVVPQEGDFYGGWITKNLKGPFKGAPGTRGW